MEHKAVREMAEAGGTSATLFPHSPFMNYGGSSYLSLTLICGEG